MGRPGRRHPQFSAVGHLDLHGKELLGDVCCESLFCAGPIQVRRKVVFPRDRTLQLESF